MKLVEDTGKNYLIEKLTLQNFMLHRDTTIKFEKKPILLVTGSNGSGKTQILDALILALGYHPRRLKKSKFLSVIGGDSDKSIINLNLNNPKINNNRCIKATEKNIDELIDFNKFEIEVIIDKDSGITYFIKNKTDRSKVRRKDIRDIFSNLNIKADNKLAFTEEGTVNVFADHTSKNKLDLLLETTGMALYRNNLIEAIEIIDKASVTIEPLKKKLELEKEYFKSMQKTRKLMKERYSLLDKHKSLVLEEVWSHVIVAEIEERGYEKALKEKKNKREKISEKLEKVRLEKEETEINLKNLKTEKKELEVNIDELQENIHKFEGENKSDERTLKNNKKKIIEIEESLEKAGESEVSKVKELEKEYRELLLKKEAYEKILDKIKSHSGEDFSGFDIPLINGIVKSNLAFYNRILEENLDFSGPVFSEVTSDTEEGYKILADISGLELFSFLFTKKKDFDMALLIYQSLFGESPPPFSIIFIPKKKIDKFDNKLDFFKAPDVVLYFLQEILNCNNKTENSLKSALKESKNLGKNIWCNGYIASPGGAVKGGLDMKIFPTYFHIEMDELKQAIESSEVLEEIKNKKKEIREEKSKQQEFSFLKKHHKELQKEIIELQENIEDNEKEIENIEKVKVVETEKYNKIIDDIDDVEKKQRKQERDVNKLEPELEKLEENLKNTEEVYEEKKSKLEELETRAKEKGEKPGGEIRETETIIKERLRLEGKLETLNISPISEEDFLNQKEKVERLESEMSGSLSHLENLRNDMEKRFNSWYSQVTKIISNISDDMGHLLKNVALGVRVRLENIRDPYNAGLYIELQRHGKDWYELSSLSGGEKVLTVESLILSLHGQTDSPLHAIDECTQRLDLKFKAMAFEMVYNAAHHIIEKSKGPYSPQFILLAPDTLGVDFPEEADRIFKRIVLAPLRAKSKKKVVIK